MPETWNDYGFPDDLAFRTFALPFTGLCKALNERAEAVTTASKGQITIEPMPIPDYFTPFPSQGGTVYANGCIDFDFSLKTICEWMVNPDKIQPDKSWKTYLWTLEELLLSVVDDPSELIVADIGYYHPFVPGLSVKWAVQRYNAINVLRYAATKLEDYPDFEYEDFYNTFNFKA